MDIDDTETSRFLQRLERRLLGLSVADRAQLVAEVRGHIEEQRVRSGGDGSLAIAALGSPKVLGRALLEARAPSLARRLAANGKAVVYCLVKSVRLSLGAILYLVAVILATVAVVKPIMPAHVGLWLTPHQLTFGILSSPGASSTERLGYWLIPLAILLATTIASLGSEIMTARGSAGPRILSGNC